MPRRVTLPPADIIQTNEALIALVQQLRNEPLVAFDTESNSLHAYREQVCLIQCSTRTHDYIIDPITITDLSALGEIFAAPAIEKVFHAAEYDIMCLKRDFGFEFVNVFDTVMAARICGIAAVGLSALIEEHFEVKLDKSHQRDDWGRRPLPEASLRYAQMDTHYLPQLRDKLYAQLLEQGHWEEAVEAFSELNRLPAAVIRDYDPNTYWHLGRPSMLRRAELLVLRELVNLREEIAQKRNVPPYKVFQNKMLVTLAQKQPTTIPELKGINGFTARQIRRFGQAVLKAIQRGKNSTELPSPPRQDSPDPVISERYSALHSWRKNRAIDRGVESDVIVSKQALWDIAVSMPESLEAMRDLNALGPWKLEKYGEEILHILHEFRQTEG